MRIYQVVGLACIAGWVFYLINGESKPLLLIVPLSINMIVLYLMPKNDKNGNSYKYLTAYKQSKKYLISPVTVNEFIEQTQMTRKEIENQISKGTISAYEYDEFLFIESNEKNN